MTFVGATTLFACQKGTQSVVHKSSTIILCVPRDASVPRKRLANWLQYSSDSTKVTSEFFSLSGPSSSEVIEVPVVAQVRHGIQITKPLKLFKVAHGVGQAVQGPATSLQFSHTAPNSIFLVPQLLTGEECDTLISHSDSADRELSESSSGGAQSGRPFRWMAHLWPPPLTELVADVVSNRLLPTLGLDDGPKIKLLVRCITRYTPGCVAPPHTDPGAFTAVVVLDDLTKDVGEEPPFLGGCTEFWPDEVDDAAMVTDAQSPPLPALRVASVRPGGAVIFGQGVVHAAGEVTKGVRHVLVLVVSLAKGRER